MLKNMKIKTVGLLIALVLLITASVVLFNAYSLYKELNNVKSSWVKFNAERSTRYRMLRKLNAVLGYGGMIHNYKNFFIRKDSFYLRKTEQSIATAHFILSSYRSIADNEEQKALDNIEVMLDEYSDSLILIDKLNSFNVKVDEVSSQVLVDNKLATDSLLFLQKKSLENSLYDGQNVLKGSRLQLLNWLRAGMGFNGMIHHFKNYIIRHDQSYWDATQNDFSYLFSVINKYKLLPLEAEEAKAIELLSTVIRHYKKNMGIARDLIAQGKTVEEIDQVVAIDDSLAFSAFATISRVINQQNEYEARVVKERLQALEQGLKTRTVIIVILLLLSILAVMSLLVSKIIAPVSYLTQTMQKLADNKLDTVIDIETGDNEIGIMARTLKVFKNNAIVTLKDAQLIQKIMSSAGEGIYGVDINGNVTFINPKGAEMLGWDAEELLGKNIHDICHYKKADGSDYPAYECPTRHAMELSKEISATEEIFWRKNSKSFPIEMTTSPLFEEGEVSGAVVLFQDVTERKRIEKMKAEFISVVSHELRTPLTSIRGSLGLIMGGAVGQLPEKAQELLKIATNNTERLLMLINDILDVEKIESGSMNFHFENLQLIPMIEQSLKENAAYADQYDVKFVLKSIVKDVSVYADKGRFMQIMANLLSNAAKFSRAHNNVEISVVETQNHKIRISVTDHGYGIPEEFQPKLFEKFTQSDSSDTRQKGGTGLGLSITKAIVEKHNGTLNFISREGLGTTFYFDLPAKIEVDTSELVDESTDEDSNDAGILIIEDDEDVATLLRMMLTQGGYNTDIAYTLNQARKFMRDKQNIYQAITLDLALPNENGIDFLNELRQNPETRDIPVVVVSATADETKRELNGGAVGLADWLNKPIDEDRLLDVIKKATVHGKKPRVLHVEDDDDVCTVIAYMLADSCKLTRTGTLSEARDKLMRYPYDLVLLDVGLPDGSGLNLLETIEKSRFSPKVVVFSAKNISQEYADSVSAVLMKSQTDNARLFKTITNILKNNSTET